MIWCCRAVTQSFLDCHREWFMPVIKDKKEGRKKVFFKGKKNLWKSIGRDYLRKPWNRWTLFLEKCLMISGISSDNFQKELQPSLWCCCESNPFALKSLARSIMLTLHFNFLIWRSLTWLLKFLPPDFQGAKNHFPTVLTAFPRFSTIISNVIYFSSFCLFIVKNLPTNFQLKIFH